MLLIAVSLYTLVEIPSGPEAFLRFKFSKTPAQYNKALDDLWLDPVQKKLRTSFRRWQRWNSSVETAVKEMIEIVCLNSIGHKQLFISSWLMTEASSPFSS